MKIGRVEKLVCNLHNKEKYPTHINTLQQLLNHVFKIDQLTPGTGNKVSTDSLVKALYRFEYGP